MGEVIQFRAPKAGRSSINRETFDDNDGHVFEVPKTSILACRSHSIDINGLEHSESWIAEIPNPYRAPE